MATLSELDLLGLAQYLSVNERSRDVDWHLQFHYNIFEGRDPEYAQQRTRLEAVRSQFQLALGKLSDHRLHFYNTSEPLNDQYNCLHVARFESLAYPINPDFTKPRRQRKPDRPLRITCAGAIRTEKGHSRLSRLVLSLWQGCLANGKAQMVVQSKKSRRRDVPRLQLAQPGRPQAKAGFTLPDETNSSEPIVYVRQPLSTEDYVKFVREADIGLMLYDSHRYYARRAGVLGEFLAAGIPVIVPAGCWLAEQIKEPMFQHLDRVADSLPVTRHNFLPKMTFGDASDPAVESLAIPHSSEEMLVSFRLGEPRCKGRYVRLEAFQFDKGANLLQRTAQTIGHRAERGLTRTLFHLHPNAAQVRLHWRNAYHHELLTVDGVEVSFHSTQSHSGTYPAGAVGLIAADYSAVPSLIREMIAHFDHYKKTAEEFSRDWFRRHDPAETVAQLVKHRAHRPGLLTDYEAA
ncbi:MAG: hypothetical protein IH991_19515 [Planctomycetes bacterium]|nr:hypothetical protein [Planctomycetota bacterium]